MIIKILGVGCQKCKNLDKLMLTIRDRYNLKYEVQKVTELDDIMEYGILMTPGLVINEEVKSVGKIPKEKEILKWLGVE
ncbi:MAG: thioredoxin family protein [Candidatus Marinimicrobia bacterium]|jgi:small redox-active disulfide protein 2|nr:thioredoxin family protein [Candidatus Neomarinimicrobiota bacterium]MBT3634215.1 thioredoxin family protein [Candidatus Neomarinimicrobiota bacterium]MBT3682986.1 thioredoxin family protein [Candidatus Neomarinimicrobiota bacterium]MBT3760024.1 thioredoxin family protein [Candidatus Neomarinimicrobiota bacterium]MBT3896209.1 thioredoxin family protein [Candidatus Neomarinimicrobiota bacterium]